MRPIQADDLAGLKRVDHLAQGLGRLRVGRTVLVGDADEELCLLFVAILPGLLVAGVLNDGELGVLAAVVALVGAERSAEAAGHVHGALILRERLVDGERLAREGRGGLVRDGGAAREERRDGKQGYNLFHSIFIVA